MYPRFSNIFTLKNPGLSLAVEVMRTQGLLLQKSIERCGLAKMLNKLVFGVVKILKQIPSTPLFLIFD